MAKNSLQNLLQKSASNSDNNIYKPILFRLSSLAERKKLTALLSQSPSIKIYNTLQCQLDELIKIKHPSKKLTTADLNQLVTAHLDNIPEWQYGVWAYYAWSEKLVHILDEVEFIELRTNRNLYKITTKERETLSQKKIGLIGLSVGQSIALTLAMERSFGELRIADFDLLELSNLNRVRTGLHNINIPKVVNVAREISEIDPYLQVTGFTAGINEDNLDEFLLANGKLDILIEECDSIDIKILARRAARKYAIPVIMDTSDRGMIDIERFDLEPQRPILHGMIEGLNINALANLSLEEKLPYVLKIAGGESISDRAKVSLIELNQSISTWPQLASAVVNGGGVTGDLVRRILLDQLHISGRFYFDPESIVKDTEQQRATFVNPHLSLNDERQKEIILSLGIRKTIPDQISPDITLIKSFIDAALQAPSTGNDQPWHWSYFNGRLYLFNDTSRSFSFADYKNIASNISFGATLENLVLAAHSRHIELSIELFPSSQIAELVAVVSFFKNENKSTEAHVKDELFNYIYSRRTNRSISPRIKLNGSELSSLRSIVKSEKGARVYFTEDEKDLIALGEIISACDRIRVMHPHGHYDFFHREMRWTDEEAKAKKDGMYVGTLELPPAALIALKMIREKNVIDMLREIDGGLAFKNVSVLNTMGASAMGLIVMPHFNSENFLKGGRAMQRMWLEATRLGLSIHPLIAPLYLFPRVLHEKIKEGGLNEKNKSELIELRNKFKSIFPLKENQGEIFLFKLFKNSNECIRPYRKHVDEIFSVLE